MDTTWLRAAQENFREAVVCKDWSTARAVMYDTADNGFLKESKKMFAELNEKIPEYSAPHGYILGFLKKKNEEYKAKGLVPTLDLLIEDLTG